ncbi:alanine dehydrogenase [Methylosinus sp. Sm6]|uniref:alanine dehydrogenase n=1 Tax=Methylosinus sp. Sm6 TaxID=2866948 RepID=UPI001C9A1620|nr:alanine dehydrogenase [Methylosinus sp. Sm6]MBY6243561.1 alanine dehydrogenase [Methylosinus sp. Sm6]
MRVGAPKEIKDNEFRVALTPAGVFELVRRGHVALIERGAGEGAGIADAAYEAAGATLAEGPAGIFETADLIVKVKEPQPRECERLRPGQILFTYLHLAADRALTLDLLHSGAVCVAYETVTSPFGGLPLLAPMSEIAGRLAPQAGARCLEKPMGGRGVLLAGAPGVPPAEVLVLGAGVVGTQAAMIALGMGASVTVADRSPEPLRRLQARFGNAAKTIFSTPPALAELAKRADLVIGAALLPGAAAPKLIARDMLAGMKPGAVIVDVAIDQGGCCETSHPTTHSDPSFVVDGIVHYCVANMPGAVPRTSTFALASATLPHVLALADQGLGALREDPHLRAGLNIIAGEVVNAAVAAAHDLPSVSSARALGLRA